MPWPQFDAKNTTRMWGRLYWPHMRTLTCKISCAPPNKTECPPGCLPGSAVSRSPGTVSPHNRPDYSSSHLLNLLMFGKQKGMTPLSHVADSARQQSANDRSRLYNRDDRSPACFTDMAACLISARANVNHQDKVQMLALPLPWQNSRARLLMHARLCI